jgi:hypothetical protein
MSTILLSFCREKSKEREFIADFIARTPKSGGERLANWLQPDSFVDPEKCEVSSFVTHALLVLIPEILMSTITLGFSWLYISINLFPEITKSKQCTLRIQFLERKSLKCFSK